MKLSLVVPCYNEQDNVERFFDACKIAFEDKIQSYEIIFVNDGSRDETWKRLKQIFNRGTQNVKIINFSRNFGKEAAMYAGLQKADGEYICIIDADLQQRPEIAVEMSALLDEHPEYDCVAAYQDKRIEGKTISFFKKVFYKFVNKYSEVPLRTGASDFRVFRRNVLSAILEMKEYYRFSKGIFSWVGFNTFYIPYEVQQRAAGKSAWSFGKLLRYAWNGFVSFSTLPLKIATFSGCLCSLFALLFIINVVIQKLFFGITQSGYPTIVVLILLIGGIQLLTLGIIGEYIAHIYVEGKHRPIYISKEFCTYEDKENEDK